MEPDPKLIERELAWAKEERKRRQEKPSQTEVLAADQTQRPFSCRLTMAEIIALKGLARCKGMSTSDYVRSLLQAAIAAENGEPEITPQEALAKLGQIRAVLSRPSVPPRGLPKMKAKRAP